MIACDWCDSENTEQVGSDWCSPVLLCKTCGHEFYGPTTGEEVEDYLTMLNQIMKTMPTE